VLSDDQIAEIRARTDIAALIGEYVRLVRAGASFKGLCPFHNEKSPSFYVTPSKQFFHCFGCGVSGDVITFLMKLEGRPFPEAARLLAERGGVELPEEDTLDAQEHRRARQRRERLGSLMGAATDFYMRMLAEHPLGGMAQDELARRGVSPDTARHFRLGYAPHGWDALATLLAKDGWSAAEAEELGLLVPRRARDGHYDRFRHRLVFPIADVHGTVIAFSGRLLPTPPGEKEPAEGEAGAKYVNSPESPLYKKGETLFGLHEGRVAIRRQGVALVCEGNFDLVMLHQAGFEQAVAPMGTALTLAQAKLLRRFAERVVCVFDGDNAGRKAGVAAKVVTLPRGDDPDTFLRERGADAFRALVDNAPGIVEHLIEDAAEQAGADPQARAAGVASLGPMLAAIENEVERSLYVERVAQRFAIGDVGVVRRTLRQGVMAARAAGGGGRAGQSERGGPQGGSSQAGGRAPLPSATGRPMRGATGEPGRAPRGERGAAEALDPQGEAPPAPVPQRRPAPLEGELVGALIDQPELFASEDAENLLDVLTSPDLRAIFDAAREAALRGRIDAAALLAAVGQQPLRKWLEERLSLEKYDVPSAQRVLSDGLPRLRLAALHATLTDVKQQVLQARRRGDDDAAMALQRRVDELHAAIFSMQGGSVQGGSVQGGSVQGGSGQGGSGQGGSVQGGSVQVGSVQGGSGRSGPVQGARK
jgi:DNA primase